MKTINAPLIVALLFPALIAGCANEYLVDVDVIGNQAIINSPNISSAAEAIDIFNELAKQFGFKYKKQFVNSDVNNTIVYSGQLTNAKYKAAIDMYIVGRDVCFYVYSGDLDDAKKVASLIEHSLKQKGVTYSVSIRTGGIFN